MARFQADSFKVTPFLAAIGLAQANLFAAIVAGSLL
jgi:hypothetical protein